MITTKHVAALLGFLFVLAWIRFSFGDAVLCLLGATAFYLVGAFLQGDLDLNEIQSRFGGRSSSGQAPPVPPPTQTRVR